MDIQQRKEEYLKKKYYKLANDILEIIDTPEKLKQEVKSNCYSLWRIYHGLDMEIQWIRDVIETENGTIEQSRRPRCDSCDEYRVSTSSPTF